MRKDFYTKEKQILTGIQQKGILARENGLVSKLPEKGKSIASYLIFLKYADDVGEEIERFSNEVHNALNKRTITYRVNNSHSTIADKVEIINGNEFNPNNQVLSKLTYSAIDALSEFNAEERKRNMQLWTMFFNYTHSDDSVILLPEENRGNFELINLFSDKAKDNGVDVRKAWGTHMIVNRFNQLIPSSEMEKFNSLFRIDERRSLISENNFPNCSNDGDIHCPESLNVGYFVMNTNGFDLKTYESFEIL